MNEKFGRYQLLNKLAAGGMAEIFLAREEGSPTTVVIKRILPHLAENEYFIAMFLDEARLAARLNHPNIVQVLDLGKKDENLFLAMEYIYGDDLRRFSRQADTAGTPIPIHLVVRIVAEVCKGLDYAHKKTDAAGKPLNIVHRDVSPQNVLVAFNGAVKIVDFGIAKAADQITVTRTGVLKGKYSYMSPEQVAGQSLDRRSDIFALGIILHELLTGKRLFKRANDVLTLEAVAQCKVAPPSSINPNISPALDGIVLKALSKNRAHRFTDAKMLGAALEDWLSTQEELSTTMALAAFMRKIYAPQLQGDEGSQTQAVEEGATTAVMSAVDTKPLPPPVPEENDTARNRPRVATARRTETFRVRSGANQNKRIEPSLGTLRMDSTSARAQPALWLWLLGLLLLGATVGAASWWFLPQWLTDETAVPHTLLVIDSEPPGARAYVNGEWVGVTPLGWAMAPGAKVDLRLELIGFVTAQDSFVVSRAAEEPHRYKLGTGNSQERR